MSPGDPLLFLAHRLPYPPNKGDKVRSYHLLRFLAERYRVHLGAFVDDPEDVPHVETLRPLCADVYAPRLAKATARLRGVAGLATGGALSVAWYRHAGMQQWVRSTLARGGIRRALVFSSPMAQYVLGDPTLRRVIDFVDVDSQKWLQYAGQTRAPLAWIYAREGARLAAFETRIAREFDASVFVTRAESRTFRSHGDAPAERVHAVPNGVDADYFSLRPGAVSPYPGGGPVVVFTGAMDYRPNIDAVEWFVRDILPSVRAARADVRFCIVGARPVERVRRLAEQPGVLVTGTVADVRPWLQFAAVAVAPMRIARGIQNKILEAMAMERPVVVTAQAAEGVSAVPGKELLVASTPAEFAGKVLAVLDGRHAALGRRARARVLETYDWTRNLSAIGELLERNLPPAAVETRLLAGAM